MDKNKLTRLVNENLSTNQIAKELNCSQTNVRYWLRKHKLTTKRRNNLKCVQCDTRLQGNQTKFCSNKKCKQDYHYKNGNTYFRQIKVAKERKQVLINMRGGGCERCGYNKCLAAIDFHHNQGIKNFPLSARNLSNTTMKRILEEFKLCEVLCSNCHREEHYLSGSEGD